MHMGVLDSLCYHMNVLRRAKGVTMEQLLTVEDVADRLQIHPETIRRWLREGRLDGYRISRRGGWRVRPESVEKMLDEMDPHAKLAA